MPRLSQVVAAEAGTKTRTYAELTEYYKKLQKPALVSGISRTYQPIAEGGEPLPAESTRVQIIAEDVIRAMVTSMTKLFDVTATKDWANCRARAPVLVDGEVLLEGVPVTYLLFLAKQLRDLRAVIVKLPVHDPADRWEYDPSQRCYRTEPPVVTYRSKKVPRNHVKAEATDKHPAQVDVYFEDVNVGAWTAVKFTGGIPAQRQAELLGRVDTLIEAVGAAREEANAMQAEDVHIGTDILGWLFR